MMMPKISLCIATWKRASKLKEIILLLEHQSIPRSEYEVIVVDSNSPDETSIVVKKLQSKFSNIIYIEDAANILATKRNVGVAAANSDIIVFMDDDVYPTKKFVEAHLKANEQPTNSFYCGQIRFERDLVKTSNYYYFRDQQHLKRKDIGVDLPFNNIVVMNLSFRKEYYTTTGGVCEEYIGYGCEDIDFGWRVKQAGFSIRYLPDALAIHKEDSSNIREYGNKLYKSGLYGSRIFKKLCPEGYSALSGKYDFIGYLLSFFVIRIPLEKYLLITDKLHWAYSFVLYKAYLYSKTNQGKRDQKKHAPLDIESSKKGW